jgi:phosphoribosylanthranilate isomerase
MRIKICGITNAEDCRLAVGLGADAIGFNFYPASPRSVEPRQVGAMLQELPPFVEPVGLFVNQPLRDIFSFLSSLGGIRSIQWHGDNPEPGDGYPFHYIPAFAVGEKKHLDDISRYLAACRELGKLPAAILMDAHVPGRHGGTGRTFPWGLLTDFQPGVPFILAGGLNPDNVAEAIRRVRPYAVDVASGVEQAPGRKDPERLRRFIGNAREAAARLGGQDSHVPVG